MEIMQDIYLAPAGKNILNQALHPNNDSKSVEACGLYSSVTPCKRAGTPQLPWSECKAFRDKETFGYSKALW